MRFDPAHLHKLQRTILRGANGDLDSILLDHSFMAQALLRLPLWERGFVFDALMHAAKSRHPNKAQRALLALFVTNADIEETRASPQAEELHHAQS
jgi:hypothetical protein